MSDPILIDCEGSGYKPARVDRAFYGPKKQTGVCAMCGNHVYLTVGGRARKHKRDDVLTRIQRGDFG